MNDIITALTWRMTPSQDHRPLGIDVEFVAGEPGATIVLTAPGLPLTIDEAENALAHLAEAIDHARALR